MPVPGIPTVVVVRPLVLKVFLKPFGPIDTLALFALRFRRTPGAIFLLFLYLKPMKSLLFESLQDLANAINVLIAQIFEIFYLTQHKAENLVFVRRLI